MGKGVVVPASAGSNQMVLASRSSDWEVILKSVRDLAKTTTSANMDDIEELHAIAFENLKLKMSDVNGVEGVIKADPVLNMAAYKLISSVRIQMIEAKRKSTDTLLKARNLLDPTFMAQAGDDYEDDPFEDEGDEPDGATIQEAGVFGGVILAGETAEPVEEGFEEGYEVSPDEGDGSVDEEDSDPVMAM